MQHKTLPEEFRKRMVLDALQYLREQDPTLAYRRSCREGVCGSDGMNINGKTGWLASLVHEALGNSNTLIIRPLPGMPVIRDLVVDQSLFLSIMKNQTLVNQRRTHSNHRTFAKPRTAQIIGRPLRMYSVWLLHFTMSFLVVEP